MSDLDLTISLAITLAGCAWVIIMVLRGEDK